MTPRGLNVVNHVSRIRSREFSRSVHCHKHVFNLLCVILLLILLLYVFCLTKTFIFRLFLALTVTTLNVILIFCLDRETTAAGFV